MGGWNETVWGVRVVVVVVVLRAALRVVCGVFGVSGVSQVVVVRPYWDMSVLMVSLKSNKTSTSARSASGTGGGEGVYALCGAWVFSGLGFIFLKGLCEAALGMDWEKGRGVVRGVAMAPLVRPEGPTRGVRRMEVR